MDASKRLSNPNNFNPDGKVKNGIVVEGKRYKLKWNFSKGYIDAKKQNKECDRLMALKRSLHQRGLANELVKLAGDGLIYINKENWKAQMQRAEYDEGEETYEKGCPKKKRRGGENISSNAPGQFVSFLKNRLTMKVRMLMAFS